MTDLNASSEARPITQRIVTEVAATKDVEPTELPPLYYTIDPGPLTELFEHRPFADGDTLAKITFQYAGCRVDISGDGTVDARLQPQGDTEGAVRSHQEATAHDSTDAPTADPEAPD